ncbi:MAG: hypothetical protein NUV80_04690 [Candidatus Berkelbacteria bacterium]|nr:hypothetical protein [Candidatus Berkelbacteria bacterium]MCR4307837.1 hypothetical protein [Candidatus Berkelbacteria bacterium]
MEDKILEKLIAHDQRFDAVDQRFDAVDQRFDAHDQRFDAVDQHLKEIGDRLRNHETRLMSIEENMATKSDLAELRNAIMNGLDKQMVILQRLDQERVVATHRLDQLEARVGAD